MQPNQPQRRRPDYDQALKRRLARAHDGFLALIAPGLTWQGERSPELPAVARQADMVWEVHDEAGERGLLHVELQTVADEQMGERVAEYKLRLWRRDHLPVQSVVVFLRPTDQVSTSPFVIPWRKGESLRSTYEVVKLWEIPAERVLATTYYDLWPLASVMGDVTLDKVVAAAEQIAAAPLSLEERGELTGLLVVLSDLRLRRREVLESLRRNPMIDELVRSSSLFEEAMDEGMRESVRLVLEERFGPIDSDLVAAIGQARNDELRTLVKLSASGTLEKIRAHLGLK
jgi:hypothetical protein